MANWYGAARTNYVTLDLPGLQQSLAPFGGLAIQGQPSGDNARGWVEPGLMASPSDGAHPGKHCLLSYADNGGWPSYNDQDQRFSFQEHVMPHVAEGEVLVAMCSGAEKLRYVTGEAEACMRVGDQVQCIQLSLGDIYERAREAFGLERAHVITECEY